MYFGATNLCDAPAQALCVSLVPFDSAAQSVAAPPPAAAGAGDVTVGESGSGSVANGVAVLCVVAAAVFCPALNVAPFAASLDRF